MVLTNKQILFYKYFCSFVAKEYKGIYYLYIRDRETKKVKKHSTKTTSQEDADKFKDKFIEDNIDSYLNPKLEEERIYKNCQIVLGHFDDTYEIWKFGLKKRYNSKHGKNRERDAHIDSNINNLKEYFHNKKLLDISEPDILDYFEWRSENSKGKKPLSLTTINIEKRTLKSYFNHAITMKLINENPLAYENPEKIKKFSRTAIPSDEYIEIYNKAGDSLRKIMDFTVLTGCRLNEVVNLQFKDLDFKNRIIKIQCKPDIGFKTKNGDDRKIPMNDVLYKLLFQLSENVKTYNDYKDRFVFSKDNKTKYHKTHISKLFSKKVKQLGYSHVFHSMRHTFATMFLQQTSNIYDTKTILGHTDIKTTEFYLHEDDKHLASQMNKVSFAGVSDR